jgi:pimeloyl-ACP methyl ester carboxylesterase
VLCTETFGEPDDPAILLIAGLGCSMLWWEDEFCAQLADGGRYVIRYDQRDTGRSVTYPPGEPGYGGAELIADAIAVLDEHEISAAHIVGLSAGGGMAQELALLHPDRVLSLAVISTSPASAVDRELPAPSSEFNEWVASASVDWDDRQSIVDYLVSYERMLAGKERSFDEESRRELISRDAERARDYAAIQNHDLIAGEAADVPPLSALAAPTLVLHGTADPMFPIEHGEALAEEIPGASLVRLEGAGHGLLRDDWDQVAEAILRHTTG